MAPEAPTCETLLVYIRQQEQSIEDLKKELYMFKLQKDHLLKFLEQRNVLQTEEFIRSYDNYLKYQVGHPDASGKIEGSLKITIFAEEVQ